MKLQKEDLDMYMYDYNTRNKSFLEVHEQLKKLGVENNSFFLKLQNTELQGVDPYDPSLNADIKRLIIEECRNNIFYFMREVVRLPGMGGDGMPFRLDKGSLAALYSFSIRQNFYLMKSRQLLTSGTIKALSTWVFMFGTQEGVSLYSHKDHISSQNLTYIKKCCNLLPDYIRHNQFALPDTDNCQVLSIKTMNNPLNRGVWVKVASDPTEGKRNYIFCDEATPSDILSVTTITNPDTLYMFASIPVNKNDYSSDIDVKEDTCIWNDSFYDLPVEVFINQIAEQSPKYHIVYIEYDYKQLEFGRDYFIKTCMSLGVSEETADLICKEIMLQ